MTKTWRERVIAARKRGKFTAADRDLVDNWHTCAVGEQHNKYPLIVKYELENPVDPELHRLGDISGFFDAVRFNNIERADELLDQIEDRVLQLKREYTDGGSTQGSDA